MMEEKLLHAEFKRELLLQAIVKKAQEEEAKVKEVMRVWQLGHGLSDVGHMRTSL